MMRNLKQVFLITAMATLLLSGCGREHHVKDLKQYIETLQKDAAAEEKNKTIPVIAVPTAVSYQAEKFRSPFETAVVTSAKGTIVNPLNAYSLRLLHLVGILRKNDKDWAVIQLPDGKIYLVTIGDKIGDHYAKITKIEPDHIEVMEETENETGKAESLTVLQLKDGS